ncbi:hypothetical protein OBBRIDRAFT_837441 [Obba rivulosa]|uniref:Chitinase II/V-like catalytic domain-containing protein n=1 Tax=Obba rivulosa TaxID=1052685 RepID=A0A8E2AXN7_9APHY|nr:hypothetical protein OBBRIDRAFT_837441 [Obba rivulosa]
MTFSAKASTPIAAAYYPDRVSNTIPPKSVDFSRSDILFFAFATPNPSSTLSWNSGATSMLNTPVSSAHSSGHGNKIVLSIGGWGGSKWFSQAMSSAHRSAFVNAIAFGTRLFQDHLGAAVTDLPWIGSNSSPLTDVSTYAKQMTYANIIAQAALSQWTKAAFPASELMFGLSLYGYVSQSTKTTLEDIARPPPGFLLSQYLSQSKQQTLGLHMRNPKTGEACPVPEHNAGEEGEEGRVKGCCGDLSAHFGQQIAFNQIVALGALKKSSNGTYVQAHGYTEGWNNCSDTPYLFNTSRQTVVTYDDTYSLADKATFGNQNGTAGCFTWSLDQVIRKAAASTLSQKASMVDWNQSKLAFLTP